MTTIALGFFDQVINQVMMPVSTKAIRKSAVRLAQKFGQNPVQKAASKFSVLKIITPRQTIHSEFNAA
jgi:hypothetical protein